MVLTTKNFYFSLPISQLMAKAIPVRGAKFEKPAFEAGFLLFCVRKICRVAASPYPAYGTVGTVSAAPLGNNPLLSLIFLCHIKIRGKPGNYLNLKLEFVQPRHQTCSPQP